MLDCKNKMMFRNVSGQVAMEFLISVSIVIVFIVIFSNIIVSNVSDINRDKSRTEAYGLGKYVQEEIYLASVVSDGYTRVVELPYKINGLSYDILGYNDTLFINVSGSGSYYAIPNINGTFNSNRFTIKRQKGVIYVE